MLNKMAVMFAFLLLHCISYAHDELMCFRWDYETCVPGPAFSADNVHHTHNTVGIDGEGYLEASWHKTEPLLALISGRRAIPDYVDIWRLEYVNGYATFTGKKEPLRFNHTYTKLAVTSDKAVIGTINGKLEFWDLEQDKFLYDLQISDDWVSGGWVTELLPHPSHDWLLVVTNYRKLIRVDLKSQAVAEIQLQANEFQDFNALAFSSDGRLLAAAGSGMLGIWHTDTWEAWEPRPLPADSAEVLRFTEDDSHLLVISYASVNRWSLVDKRLDFLRKLEPYAGRRYCFINDGDISPDGSLLMTTDECGQIRAWDLAADAEIYIPQLDFTEPPVRGEIIRFSPDGRLLFTGGSLGWGLWIIHQPD